MQIGLRGRGPETQNYPADEPNNASTRQRSSNDATLTSKDRRKSRLSKIADDVAYAGLSALEGAVAGAGAGTVVSMVGKLDMTKFVPLTTEIGALLLGGSGIVDVLIYRQIEREWGDVSKWERATQKEIKILEHQHTRPLFPDDNEALTLQEGETVAIKYKNAWSSGNVELERVEADVAGMLLRHLLRSNQYDDEVVQRLTPIAHLDYGKWDARSEKERGFARGFVTKMNQFYSDEQNAGEDKEDLKMALDDFRQGVIALLRKYSGEIGRGKRDAKTELEAAHI